MSEIPLQPFLIRIPSEQARRVTSRVNLPDSAYESVSEFILVAIENQLALEEVDEPSAHVKVEPTGRGSGARKAKHDGRPTRTDMVTLEPRKSAARPLVGGLALLRRPGGGQLPVRSGLPQTGRALSAFTNRLAPLIAGPRVLANMTDADGPPPIEAAAEQAAKSAREFGFKLYAEDEQAGRRGRHRRSIGWPIGDDESKSLMRFRSSFMFAAESDGKVSGPLVEFGLVTTEGGKLFLTEQGKRLVFETVPAIDEAGGLELLSAPHRQILASSLAGIPGEVEEVRLFLSAIDLAAGAQDEVDKSLAREHVAWTDAQVVSHRAAMVGRLRDLHVIDIDPLQAGKARIVPGSYFGDFSELLARSIDESERVS
jgi:hypothetical protein